MKEFFKELANIVFILSIGFLVVGIGFVKLSDKPSNSSIEKPDVTEFNRIKYEYYNINSYTCGIIITDTKYNKEYFIINSKNDKITILDTHEITPMNTLKEPVLVNK